MIKIGPDMVWILGNPVHKDSSVGLQFADVLYHCLSTDVLFQVVVEIYIRVAQSHLCDVQSIEKPAYCDGLSGYQE